MKVWVRMTIFAGASALALGAVSAPPRAESRLAGIKLYDTGVDVVKRFGSPNDILSITWTTTEAAGGGGGGAGGGFAGAPAGGGGGRGGIAPIDFVVPPMSSTPLGQLGLKGGGGAGPAPMGGGGGGQDMGGGGGATGVSESQYVRWVYRRGPSSSLNVVLNKFNKVVQIEAIGVSNRNVRTSRGITLGSSLAEVIKKYQNPDAYDVGSDYFMVRFLRTAKVAFRFTRESAQAPYRVTSIVVSAGKA